jgi:hypothetical protein
MKRHLPFALIILVLAVCGCASSRQQLTLAHDVEVPKDFRAGSFSKDHPFYMEGDSTVERYVMAYEHGWAECVQRFAKNINFDDPSPFIFGGWVEEQAGGSDGYWAARDRIEQLIRIYGEQKVSDYLQQFKLPEEK